MAYYRQPEFYRSFQCIGDKCPFNCCCLWRIDWAKAEYEKLLSAPCSPELTQLLKNGFIPGNDNETMIINLRTDNGKQNCSFLMENGLCRIQHELGEEYLSNTCKNYPRKWFSSGDLITRSCSSSCYQVMKILCENPNAMEIVNAPLEKDNVTIQVQPISSEERKNHLELKYYNELFEFFYDIISDKKRSIETSLVLGALAAQKITEYINCGEYNRIPEIIKALRPQLNTQTVPSFDKIKPNYGICLGIVSKCAESLSGYDVFSSIKIDGKISVEKYLQGKAILEEFTNNTPFFLRNFALNLLFESYFPFYVIDRTLFENYCYFVTSYAISKLIGSSIALKDETITYESLSFISYYIRLMYYSPNSTKSQARAIIDILHENAITSPAKLALMLK